jgi:hypothetical protein
VAVAARILDMSDIPGMTFAKVWSDAQYQRARYIRVLFRHAGRRVQKWWLHRLHAQHQRSKRSIGLASDEARIVGPGSSTGRALAPGTGRRELTSV